MYSKEQASILKQEFWTTFGRYMKPVHSAEGSAVNWLNYKTGFRHVFFRMDAGRKEAYISIEMTHPDEGIRELFFEQFAVFKSLLHGILGEDWQWELHAADENGRALSRIFKELYGVNVFNQDDWPKLISFFKPRIIALDNFWSDAKYTFEALR